MRIVRWLKHFILLAGVATVALWGEVNPHSDGWEVSARWIPVPSAASQRIQGVLSQLQAPDVASASRRAPEDAEAWKALAEKVNSGAVAGVRYLAKALHVSIEQTVIAGVPVYRVMPQEIDPRHKKHLFLFLHGGAYVLLGGEAGAGEAVLIAARARIPVISIDFRMPPDHPAPAAVDDVVQVWKELLKTHPAASMALGGSSSGGGLTLSTLHRLKALKLDLPAALYLGTPAVEVDQRGDSRYINEGIDHLLPTWNGVPYRALAMYAANYDHKDPAVSPIYGDFRDFPPSYLITGTRDLLLSDTIRTHRKLRAAGIRADLNVYEGLSHREYVTVSDAPESKEHYRELNAFLLEHLSH